MIFRHEYLELIFIEVQEIFPSVIILSIETEGTSEKLLVVYQYFFS